MRVKLVVATTVVVAALGLTGGAALLSKADAQPPEVVKEAAGLLKALDDGQPPVPGAPGTPPRAGGGAPGWAAAGTPATWEYKFVDLKNDRKEFEKVVTQQGKEGWEFCGSERFDAGPAGKPGELTLVFKKPEGGNFGGGGGGTGGTGGNRGGGGSGGTSGAPPAPGGRNGSVPAPVGGAGADLPPTVLILEYLKADEVATTVTKLFPKGLTVTADTVSNSLALSGDVATLKTACEVIEEFENRSKAAKAGKVGKEAGKEAGPLTVIPLKYASIGELADVLLELFPNVEMTADERSNQIIVRADAKTVEAIQALLTKLDVEVPKKK